MENLFCVTHISLTIHKIERKMHVDYIKVRGNNFQFIMDKDTITDIITFIHNAEMNRKGTVQIPFTNITKNIVKILLREGFIENVRKYQENNKYFFVLTLQHKRNRKNPC